MAFCFVMGVGDSNNPSKLGGGSMYNPLKKLAVMSVKAQNFRKLAIRTKKTSRWTEYE